MPEPLRTLNSPASPHSAFPNSTAPGVFLLPSKRAPLFFPPLCQRQKQPWGLSLFRGNCHFSITFQFIIPLSVLGSMVGLH